MQMDYKGTLCFLGRLNRCARVISYVDDLQVNVKQLCEAILYVGDESNVTEENMCLAKDAAIELSEVLKGTGHYKVNHIESGITVYRVFYDGDSHIDSLYGVFDTEDEAREAADEMLKATPI